MLGDFLHNTRSALDHLVYDLVIISGGTVHSRHQFPIYTSMQGWQQGVVNSPPANSCLGFIDPSHVAFIESVQPYQATTGIKSLEVLRRFSKLTSIALSIVP
jgi:hypothetical protein